MWNVISVWFKRHIFKILFRQSNPRIYKPTILSILRKPRKLNPTKIKYFTVILLNIMKMKQSKIKRFSLQYNKIFHCSYYFPLSTVIMSITISWWSISVLLLRIVSMSMMNIPYDPAHTCFLPTATRHVCKFYRIMLMFFSICWINTFTFLRWIWNELNIMSLLCEWKWIYPLIPYTNFLLF